MSECVCPLAGHCERYQRTMSKREHEICRGVKIDEATAAAMRQAWLTTPARSIRPTTTRGATRKPIPCIHLGDPTGESADCPSCTGTVPVEIMTCAVHQKCTLTKQYSGLACCKTCPDFAVKDKA